MSVADSQEGVIKPSGWFSFSVTGGLEPLDVRDRPGPRLPRSEPDADAHPGPGSVRGREETVDEPATDPLEGDERRELREALLAENSRREIVEAARGAPSGEQPTLVPQRDEEPLPREAGCVDVVGLHVPLPRPVPPGVRRPLEERHRSPSRSGRKYRMSRTLPFRSAAGRQAAFTRIPIRISSFVISPKKC